MGKNLLLLFAGFGDRLLSEVKKLAPKDIKIRVRYYDYNSYFLYMCRTPNDDVLRVAIQCI